MSTCYIYELSDENGVPVYIGSTVDVRVREQSHRRSDKVFQTMSVIDECHIDNRKQVERMYVQTYRGWGFELTNWHYNFKKGRPLRKAQINKNMENEESVPVLHLREKLEIVTRSQIESLGWRWDEDNKHFSINMDLQLTPKGGKNEFTIMEYKSTWFCEHRTYHAETLFTGYVRNAHDLLTVMYLTKVLKIDEGGYISINRPYGQVIGTLSF